MNRLTDENKVRGFMSGDIVRWALGAVGQNPSREELDALLSIDKEFFFRFIKEHGFDEATASYRPLDSRYLIEKVDNRWQASFFERGRRFDSEFFDSKEEAERHVIDQIIKLAGALIQGSLKSSSE